MALPGLGPLGALGHTAEVDFTRSRDAHDAWSGQPPWRRYVALGDSFTEGLWDVPDGEPPVTAETEPPGLVCRGWADLLAGHLAERARLTDPDGEPVRYANLAVRGRLLGPILTRQVPAALELGADLVSLIGGGNDLLRSAGVDVLLGTGMDVKDSPLVRRSRGRVAVLNSHVWSIARRHGAHVLDLWGMRSLRDWRMWAPDRIHLTTEGHRRVAQGALVALGLEPDDAWDDPLAPLPPLPRVARVRADAQWWRAHAYPWATRRLRGRSSGDLRGPKRPEMLPLG